MKVKRDPWVRFWKHVNKEGPVLSEQLGPCWVWLRAKDRDGYGWFKLNNRQIYAHRFAMNEPDGLVLHRCDNPNCVRPDHLFVGSNIQNMHDKMSKGRCSAVRGAKNHNAKLSPAEVEAIRMSTETQRALAAKYRVSNQQISKIKSGQRWGAPKPSTVNQSTGGV